MIVPWPGRSRSSSSTAPTIDSAATRAALRRLAAIARSWSDQEVCGHARTVDGAIGNLARVLRLAVERWDSDADDHGYWKAAQAEPNLLTVVRKLLAADHLEQALLRAAGDAVIDPREDPRVSAPA
jgi:hypothetical protein